MSALLFRALRKSSNASVARLQVISGERPRARTPRCGTTPRRATLRCVIISAFLPGRSCPVCPAHISFTWYCRRQTNLHSHTSSARHSGSRSTLRTRSTEEKRLQSGVETRSSSSEFPSPTEIQGAGRADRPKVACQGVASQDLSSRASRPSFARHTPRSLLRHVSVLPRAYMRFF